MTCSGGRWLPLLAVTLAAVGLVPGARAQALVEQPPGHFGGFLSNAQDITVADDFEIARGVSLETIRWWGGYASSDHLPIPSTDVFTVRIFADAHGQPGVLLRSIPVGNAAARFGTGDYVNPPIRAEFEYSATVSPPLALAPGLYWVTIVNEVREDYWLWEVSSYQEPYCSQNASCVQRSFGDPISGPWSPYYYNTSFRLEGAELPPCPEVAIGVEIHPQVINLRSQGQWITCILEPSPPLGPSDIDASSIRLSTGLGFIEPDARVTPSVGDENGNGTPDLVVKFDRAGVIGLLEGDPTTLAITGHLAGDEGCFRGSDQVRVVDVHTPTSGNSIVVGETVEVQWTPASDLEAHTVDLLLSVDDGDTWTLEASGLDDDGRHAWAASNRTGARARIAVVMVRAPGAVDLRTGVSGRFSIQGTTAVPPPGTTGLAWRGVSPNPARGGPFDVSFSLAPGAGRATLALFDVTGRRWMYRDLGSLGPGPHTLRLDPRGIPAGVYVLDLAQGGRRTRARVVLMP